MRWPMALCLCLYVPLAWGQDGHVWGPDWQMIAIGLLGVVAGGLGIYWRWQSSSLTNLSTADQSLAEKMERTQKSIEDKLEQRDRDMRERVIQVEREVGELRDLVLGQCLLRTEFNEILKKLEEVCQNNLKHTLAIQRRLDMAGVPYQPPI